MFKVNLFTKLPRYSLLIPYSCHSYHFRLCLTINVEIVSHRINIYVFYKQLGSGLSPQSCLYF